MLTARDIKTRLRSEQSGFTLIELLVTAMLSMLVLTAILNLMDSGGRANARLTDKTETVQRMRMGMDRVTRVLRTQACADTGTPPIISGTSTAVTFYGDTNTTSDQNKFRPRKVALYTTAANGGSIVQDTYVPTNQSAPWTYPAEPSQRRTVVDHVSGAGGSDGNAVFIYYSFSDPDDPVGPSLSGDLSSDPLPANSIAKIVRVDVSLRVSPESGHSAPERKTAMTSRVLTRNADFSGGGNVGRTWGPRCG